METCAACQRPFDDQASRVGDTRICSRCACPILDWLNDEILTGIRDRGEDPGIEVIESDKYYYVQVEWFGLNQIYVEFTIGDEVSDAEDLRSRGVLSGLELAVQIDQSNRFNGIEMSSYICCASGLVISINEFIPEW
jgi:hypothetical protein